MKLGNYKKKLNKYKSKFILCKNTHSHSYTHTHTHTYLCIKKLGTKNQGEFLFKIVFLYNFSYCLLNYKLLLKVMLWILKV